MHGQCLCLNFFLPRVLLRVVRAVVRYDLRALVEHRVVLEAETCGERVLGLAGGDAVGVVVLREDDLLRACGGRLVGDGHTLLLDGDARADLDGVRVGARRARGVAADGDLQRRRRVAARGLLVLVVVEVEAAHAALLVVDHARVGVGAGFRRLRQHVHDVRQHVPDQGRHVHDRQGGWNVCQL